MKIAISSSGKTLDSPLDPRFGRCAWFLVIDPADMSYEVFDNQSAAQSSGAGIQAAQFLADKNIDISAIEIVKGGKTFFWSGKYRNDLNTRDTLSTELNVLADFNPIVPENYKNSDVVMLGNLHPNIQMSVINQMEKKPKLIVLDTMNYWIILRKN